MAKIKLPTNLAYSRSISPSSAVFYSFNSEKQDNKQLLEITEVTSVGTISNYKDIHTDNGKSIENSNPQTVDTCYLPLDHDSFEMTFTVAFSRESLAPHSCNNAEFRSYLNSFTENYKKLKGYEYIADLYLKNIFEAKMLWRNGLADDVQVNVSSLRGDITNISKITDSNYAALVEEVGNALAGERKRLVLKVSITAWLGDGQEVFPSQEFVQKSSEKGAKSKTLARTNMLGNTNAAAMHPQKIGNAIRQIDAWYDGFDQLNKVLAIDPACVNKPEFKAYRLKDTKRDLYSLLENKLTDFVSMTEGASDTSNLDPDIHFVVANLIRGGVFGGK